jgi:GT2 family glycosyltransferase
VRLSIDVAVVAFNRYDVTLSCLRDLRDQTREHRLRVCDNGSTDGTAERIARDWPAAHVICMDDNSGFGKACNAAAALGTGDAIVLRNNDFDGRPDFLEYVVAPLERHPSLSSVAPLCVRPGGAHIDFVGLTTIGLRQAIDLRRGVYAHYER